MQQITPERMNAAYLIAASAPVLGFLGVGHLYLGKTSSGIIFMVIGWGCLLTNFVIPNVGYGLYIITYLVCLYNLHSWLKQQDKTAYDG